jgi:hypothetical protein
MKKHSPAAAPPASPVAASIAARIARLTDALGEPLGEDPRLALYATALADTPDPLRGARHVRALAAFKYVEEGLFPHWNEEPPSETRAFWRAVEAAGLPFVRRDLLGEIGAKRRITSREHHDFATDAVGGAGLEGGSREAQAARLKQMIGAYQQGGRT